MGNATSVNDRFAAPGTPISELLKKPIVLQSAQTRRNLQNGWGRWAKCDQKNTASWEQLLILPVLQPNDLAKVANGEVVKGNRFILQSRWDNRNLQVQPNGDCRFENHNQQLWEQFTIETGGSGSRGLFFVSCHTGNVLQCCPGGNVRAASTNRQAWEKFYAILPGNTNIITERMCFIGCAIAGAVVLVVATGVLLQWVAVPAAMTAFGTIVPGVGTIHASLAAGGVAATCQASSAALLSAKSLSIAAVLGLVFGGIACEKGKCQQVFGIQSLHSEKLLNVCWGGKSDGTKVQLWGKKVVRHNQWQIIPTNRKGVVGIKSVHAGRFLSVCPGVIQDGTQVKLLGKKAEHHSLWRIVPTDEAGVFGIQSVHAGRFLSVYSDSMQAKKVKLWGEETASHNSWRFILRA